MEVLDLREAVYKCINSAQARIDAGFKKLEATARLIADIKKHQKCIDENGAYEYMEDEEFRETAPLGDTYLMCHPLWVDPNAPDPNGPVPAPTTPLAPGTSGTPGTPGTSGTPGTANGTADPAAALLSDGVATSSNGN